MKSVLKFLKDCFEKTNWDGLRCFIKGDANIRETINTLKHQQEIEKS